MCTGRMVDIEPLGNRPLELFVNSYNALQHLHDHALGGRTPHGEEHGWRLLLPALQAEMDAGHIDRLREMARGARADVLPPRLAPIYQQFLDRMEQTVEGAVALQWHWEEAPGGECRWSTLGHDGIFAHLDDDYVRTGYLPEKDPDAWSDPAAERNARYRLFLACLRRIQGKYNRNVRSNRIVSGSISTAFAQLLQRGLTEAAWSALG
jgi:hypothetical protein